MNFKKMFVCQSELDSVICATHNLNPEELYFGKVLALLVELGEVCNEARFFKYWSKDQEPREGLKEELADCLHFLLSIGISNGVASFPWDDVLFVPETDVDWISVEGIELFRDCCGLADDISISYWRKVLGKFLRFSTDLGISEEELEEEYWRKNEVNHKRQEAGY